MITGGLGMACYGMVKSLLKHGTEVDLVMPAKETAYFPLRKTQDADNLLGVFTDLSGHKGACCPANMEELRKFLGSPVTAYHTIGQSMLLRYTFEGVGKTNPFKRVFEILADQYYLFREVRHYTERAVDAGLQLEFDVIHAHDWLTYPAAMILKRLTGKPFVAHIHATEFDRAGGPGDGRIHDIEYLGMDYADRVIAVSNYTARAVSEKYLVDPKRTSVVYNAYTLPNSTNNHRRIFKEPTILFMGRITLQKGPDYFLEVARRVLQQEKKVRFIMAGSGDMERQILHRAAYMGLGTKFLAAGFLDRQEVENILATTDIFVLPSVSEPFGIAPLEAMSQGAVAIISKNSGVAEIIQSAYKVDFWDIDRMVAIIIELIRNPEKFKEMSKRGKAEVTNLQWDRAAQSIMDIFAGLKREQICLV
jgi:glycosyltransferase involved in cell wall biosynthesis